MVRFLSEAWLEELARALADAGPVAGPVAGSADPALRVRQRVLGAPSGDVGYVVSVADGSVTVTPDPTGTEPADIEILAAYPVAVAISLGTLAPAVAFGAGRLRLGGDIGLLLRHTATLEALARASASLRDVTTY